MTSDSVEENEEGMEETKIDPADLTAEEGQSEVTEPPAKSDDGQDVSAGDVPLEEVVELEVPVENEVTKWKDKALRSQAELENFRKRMAREKTEAIKFGNSALLESLLPVFDNFHFGLEAAKQESEDSVVYKGMSMVLKQLQDFLDQCGVKEIPADGVTFDPNFHDAVKQEPSDEVAEGQVL
ncbi:MAG: nucleotide exchange factor GrpE, partial [Verrucomicrobiota bacterium]